MEAASTDKPALIGSWFDVLTARLSRLWAYLASGRWALPSVYLGTAFLITNLYWHGTEQLETATLGKFVGVAANKPFAYRILMPYLIGVTAELNGIGLQFADEALRIPVLFATMLLLRRWLRHFVSPLLSDVMPLLLGVILPWSFDYYWPYDFSGLLIWTGALLCLRERQLYLYLLLFVLGTLNRETAFFLIPIFATTQWQTIGKRRVLRWVTAQFVVWVLIFLSLRLAIHPRAGEPVEIHVLNNLLFLLRGYGLGPYEHWLQLLSGAGFLWLLAPWYWSTKSDFLKRCTWVLPFHFAVMLVVGRFVETRLWYEWIPVVMALAGQTLTTSYRQTAEILPTDSAASKQPAG
ncbi:MAG: hypothetical protein JXA57_03820 [Armatimonadetes bacterium]|nr:hypothetical protein [Armatimonadota bacterium]